MATSPLSQTLKNLRGVLFRQEYPEMPDADLLDRFIAQRDEAAFEALVRRHGPMVLGVCRRILRCEHDAEDAFQATFLVLVRRASAVRPRHMVGNWLYGVAYRTALQARRAAARRRTKERQVTAMPHTAASTELWHEVQPVLDEELARLPAHYRAVLLLCDLEGKTRKQAAQHFACAEGTVASRLTRGRVLLAKRLTQRGVVLSGGGLAEVLSEHAASAGVPAPLLTSTVKAASLIAAGQAATTGVVSTRVAALVKGVLQAMLLAKLKTTAVATLALLLAGAGVFLLTHRAFAAAEATGADQPRAEVTSGAARSPTITINNVAVDELDAQQRVFTGTLADKRRALTHMLTMKKQARLLNSALENFAFITKVGAEHQSSEKSPQASELDARLNSFIQAYEQQLEAQIRANVLYSSLKAETPSRLVNVPIAPDAKVIVGGKRVKLADLQPGMHVSLDLAARETGLVIVGIRIGD